MGYIFSLADAQRSDCWFGSARGREALEFEQELLGRVWNPLLPQRVLEVGCGTGVFLDWFRSQGHIVAGLEPSGESLELARERLGYKVPLTQGFAEDLPYEDNQFDTVALITSLEFVEDPYAALREAFRVARRNVLVGALNRFSIGGVQCGLKGFRRESVYSHARFFSIFELSRMCEKILCARLPIQWRTCFSFPVQLLPYLRSVENNPLMQRNPFGHFIAMRVDMQCRVRTLKAPVFEEIPAVANVSAHSLGWWRPSLKAQEKGMDS